MTMNQAWLILAVAAVMVAYKVSHTMVASAPNDAVVPSAAIANVSANNTSIRAAILPSGGVSHV